MNKRYAALRLIGATRKQVNSVSLLEAFLVRRANSRDIKPGESNKNSGDFITKDEYHKNIDKYKT